ncbi:MAG: ABC transporter permease [Okeania sp. SIO2G4]|uniref:ABC transporter permease n=1 Tax=unclassified Okeania TaxID=2634635 RepID=UPI0013B6A6B3|nr:MULTISPECIES: ABC transporter permease [unclassified Okeania]NEP07893.1 ABC transporter permease [Okeania sp. SIO4D6]NEP37959.1 ABC transporter permease [Okeania sp. SIO2H7]NEP74942.1 ABC transporter permease [Okeania sp. SIO2G5]NEP92818.1 ABC transporter permease [Okeania sp. SIO2F5]NEQ93757.1 ABC transporter permease [Okeania sp. SIO2G4]
MTNTLINPEDNIPIDMSKSQSKIHISWQVIFTILMFLFMYLPIFVLTFYSFNKSKYSAGWEGFTLQWYVKLFQDTRVLNALQNSLTVALCAVAVSAIIGTLMAVGLAKYKFRGKSLYLGVSYLPLIIPDIAIAVATLVFLAALAIRLSLWTIIAAHIVFCLAYVGLVVSTRLADLDPNLEEAALDLGATPVQAFLLVLLPQLMPGIISGCLLAFVLSMDDFLIASFTSGSGATTLPMEIFSRIRTGVKPDINALSVILILGSGAIAIVGEFLRTRSEKKSIK